MRPSNWGVMFAMDELLKKNKQQIIKIATQHGAQSVRIFGSHARNQNHPESDLDLLVTLADGRTLLDLIAIKQDLEDILNCRVDVTTEDALSPYVRDQILNEAIVL